MIATRSRSSACFLIFLRFLSLPFDKGMDACCVYAFRLFGFIFTFYVLSCCSVIVIIIQRIYSNVLCRRRAIAVVFVRVYKSNRKSSEKSKNNRILVAAHRKSRGSRVNACWMRTNSKHTHTHTLKSTTCGLRANKRRDSVYPLHNRKEKRNKSEENLTRYYPQICEYSLVSTHWTWTRDEQCASILQSELQ